MTREILGDPGEKPYSPGIRNGNLLFVSGQLGLDADDKIVSDDVGPQTRQCLENMLTVLKTGGASVDDVTMVNIYLLRFDEDFAAMNEVYREYFGAAPPARATVEVSKLALGLKVEISCIAVVD